MKKRATLGEILIRNGFADEETVERLLSKQRKSNEKLGEILIKEGVITEEQLADAISEQGYPRVNLLTAEDSDTSLALKFGEDYLRQNLAVPYKLADDGTLYVVVYEYFNYKPLDFFMSNLGAKDIVTCVGTREEIKGFIDKTFESDGMGLSSTGGTGVREVDEISVDVDSPVVKYVSDILEKALREKASDIHIEPQFNTDSVVRFRIDGALTERSRFQMAWHRQIVSRIKVLSQLEISKQLEPQDGELVARINNSYVNMRVSTAPLINGEKVVIRVLGSSTGIVGIDKIGLSDENKSILFKSLRRRRGMILVTAPTGEGKTVTMYSALKELNKPDVNITTIEEPVEIRLPGINQIKVTSNVSFASALRSILRQDPDIIMLGEIRDDETADIAVKASITGHLLISTLHTIDTYGVISRLGGMGISPYQLADSLELIISQRLVRKLCDKCKVPDVETTAFMKKMHPEIPLKDGVVYAKTGCPHCNNIGYTGRTALFEFLTFDDKMRDLVVTNDIRGIRYYNEGKPTMYDDGILKLASGVISYEEMLKALGTTHDAVLARLSTKKKGLA